MTIDPSLIRILTVDDHPLSAKVESVPQTSVSRKSDDI